VIIAIRVAGDAAFERWQRYSALGVAALLLLLVNSRTGLLFLGAAAGLHLLLVLAKRVQYPTRRIAVAAVLLPILIVGVVGVGSGGAGFLFKSRYASGGVTSGRLDTWKQVGREWQADGVAEKLFGDAKSVRGYVTRESTGATAADRPELTTDNAAVGALRRGGILGVAAFLLGLVLLIWHALRRNAPPWFTMAAVGSLVTIVASDWLLGNTGGTLWIFLLAGEAYLLLRPKDRMPLPAQPGTD
jgi:O-antigen ligase